MKILPGSSNTISANDHVFKNPYFLCKDAIFPKIDGFNFFMHFYLNRTLNLPICNPSNMNMAKLVFLEVFIDVDLVKALINLYNPATKSFHRHNGSILCTIDKTSFIEAFGLEGQMDAPIDIDDLQGKFGRKKTHHLNNVMMPHISFNTKKVGQIPKNVEKHLPLSKFKGYFKKNVYGLHKVLGSDGVQDYVYGSLFLMACDIQDPFHNREYDYVGYIIDNMHQQIINAKKGELGNFKFHHYSLLMHLILYKNIGYLSQDFIDQTSNEFGVQRGNILARPNFLAVGAIHTIF